MKSLQQRWLEAWPEALEAWSRFTKLSTPRWCVTVEEEKQEALTGSFAMIRLQDHTVVISLRQVKQMGLQDFPREILAHEIGHHVYAPADLRDSARLMARIRAGLPTRHQFVGMVANLYTDLLINDRLQRAASLDMIGVYTKLRSDDADELWTLYMRIYEMLWRLPLGTLARRDVPEGLAADAVLGARLIRAYSKDWLDGAGRFAMLLLPYLLKIQDPWKLGTVVPWLDASAPGAGGELPEGLAEVDDGEEEGAIHPAEDEALAGVGDLSGENGPDDARSARPGSSTGEEKIGGKKNRYRSPTEYVDLMKSLGVDVPEKEMVRRYYRERAIPHLIPFPTREIREAADPLPESLDVWDTGESMAAVDWVESVAASPVIIPGVTTLQRHFGTTSGGAPERLPLDLYIGVDCSGSMGNPAQNLSYPVLAGTVMALSALRAGARVMVCLSGEPGKHSQTSGVPDGFIRDERTILSVLTGYLGTGYAFGALRLKETFVDAETRKRPTHVLVVTDSDIFHMLDKVKDGWKIARQAREKAGGGATFVLELGGDYWNSKVQRLRDECGWDVHLLSEMKDVVAFARAFSRKRYGDAAAA